MATKTPSTRRPPAGDTTRSARAVAHLERLQEAKGKRLVVDLDASGREALEALLEVGYGATQREVVVSALTAAAAKLKKKA
jgi:hypothetical protein